MNLWVTFQIQTVKWVFFCILKIEPEGYDTESLGGIVIPFENDKAKYNKAIPSYIHNCTCNFVE